MTIGIYEIKNKHNKKRYIGSSVDLKSRFNVHKHYLRNNTHKNNHLQSAWNKYGESAFIFSIVLFCGEETLHFNEQLIMNYYESYNRNKGYNLDSIVRGIVHHSEETKKKISEGNKGTRGMDGKKHTDETKKKMSKAHQGKKYAKGTKRTKKQRKKISENLMGRPVSAKTKKKISEANKGQIPWNKGKKTGPLSDQHKAKLSNIRKGRKFSEEHKRKLSEAAKNRERNSDGTFS